MRLLIELFKPLQIKEDNGLRRILFQILVILLGLSEFLICKNAQASDPQTYQVKIRSTGDSDIDATLADTSNLATLKKTKAVGAFALAGRVQSDYERLQTVMDSFGYYDAKIRILVTTQKEQKQDDNPKEKHKKAKKAKASVIISKDASSISDKDSIEGNDLALPNYIEHIPAHQEALIAVFIDKGPRYHIGKIILSPFKSGGNLSLLAKQQEAFNLKSGQPAISEDIVAAQKRLFVALQEDGHALAKVNDPTAYLHPESKTLDVEYKVDPGPRVDLGNIQFQGLEKVNQKFAYKRLLIHEGQLYQPSKIEEARQDLSELNVFSSVDVRAANQVDANGKLPLTITVKEAKRRTVSFEAGYSTDLGGRGGVRWTHHNLFGNAEQLKLAVMATGLGGTAQKGFGYDIYADFTKPDFGARNQSFNARVESVKQKLYSYNQTAILAKAGLERKLNSTWSVSSYLGAIQEHIIQQGIKTDYTMINIPLSASYDSTGLSNPMLSPTHGLRANVSVTPTESFGDGSTFFTIMQGSASTYFDLDHLGISSPSRSILAFRGTVGSVQGASQMRLPPDQRLYAGGTATVRGFRFQGVGPQFAHSKYAIGGTSMDSGTIEFRQRIKEQFGMQLFTDAGQVGTHGRPFEGKLRVGAGAGGKYYTPLGPIRLDIAVPINRPPRGDRMELYISLGETF